MYTYNLKQLPQCIAVCNNCKYYKIVDRTEVMTEIPIEKFGRGECNAPSMRRVPTPSWSIRVSRRPLIRMNDTCENFKFSIHQQFGLPLDEIEDYFYYIKFFSNYKAGFIRDVRDNKEVEETWAKIIGEDYGTV